MILLFKNGNFLCICESFSVFWWCLVNVNVFIFLLGCLTKVRKNRRRFILLRLTYATVKSAATSPSTTVFSTILKESTIVKRMTFWVTLSYGHFVIVRNINIFPVGTARSRINKSWLGSIWISNLGRNINIMRLILISLAFRVEKSAITWIITIFSAKLEFFANAVPIAERITFLKCFWFVVLNINIFPVFAPFFCIFPYRLNLI